MQFKVPQFIDVEDKIFGPFTFKQFVYLAGGVGVCFVLWRLLPTLLAVPLIGVIGGVAIGLTFYKINGQSFSRILQAYITYTLQQKLYLWKKSEKKKQMVTKVTTEAPQTHTPLTKAKAHDLAWSLDVLDKNNK